MYDMPKIHQRKDCQEVIICCTIMHTFDQFIDVIWCNIYTIALERSRSNLDDGLDEYQVFDQALWRYYWRFLLFFKQTKKINYFPFFCTNLQEIQSVQTRSCKVIFKVNKLFFQSSLKMLACLDNLFVVCTL